MKVLPIFAPLLLSGCSFLDPAPVFLSCKGEEQFYEGTISGRNVAGRTDEFKRTFWADFNKDRVLEFWEDDEFSRWDECDRDCSEQLSAANYITLDIKTDINMYDRIRSRRDERIRIDLITLSISGETHTQDDYAAADIIDPDYRTRLSGTCQASKENPTSLRVPLD